MVTFLAVVKNAHTYDGHVAVHCLEARDAAYKMSAFRQDIHIVDENDGTLLAVLKHVGYGNFGLQLIEPGSADPIDLNTVKILD